MSEETFAFKAESGNTCEIVDTFAEMFPLWTGRVLITSDSEKWALTAAAVTTGFATSVIMSPAEAGIEGIVPADETPDNRVGVLIQVYSRDARALISSLEVPTASISPQSLLSHVTVKRTEIEVFSINYKTKNVHMNS